MPDRAGPTPGPASHRRSSSSVHLADSCVTEAGHVRMTAIVGSMPCLYIELSITIHLSPRQHNSHSQEECAERTDIHARRFNFDDRQLGTYDQKLDFFAF